jgi:hypothetical protein
MIPRVHRIGIASKNPTTSRTIPRMITLASRELRLGASRSSYGTPARFAPTRVDCPEIPQHWCIPHGVAPDLCRHAAASLALWAALHRPSRPISGVLGVDRRDNGRPRSGRLQAVRRQVASGHNRTRREQTSRSKLVNRTITAGPLARSGEVLHLVPTPLELKEVGIAGQHHGAVEDLPGLLAAGIRDSTGPKNAAPSRWSVGVPTSSTTGLMPTSWLARSSSSYSVLCAAAASSRAALPRPASAVARVGRLISGCRTAAETGGHCAAVRRRRDREGGRYLAELSGLVIPDRLCT